MTEIVLFEGTPYYKNATDGGGIKLDPIKETEAEIMPINIADLLLKSNNKIVLIPAQISKANVSNSNNDFIHVSVFKSKKSQHEITLSGETKVYIPTAEEIEKLGIKNEIL